MIVVKVGGSLYDLPDLGWRLQRFLEVQGEPDWLLVAGGGGSADAIRELDRVHALGPVAAHWLALRACTVNAYFLQQLLPECVIVETGRGHRGPGILDSYAFCVRDEGEPGSLPHLWDATSDAVAARAAQQAGAELVLLKSVTIPVGMSWEDAARVGYVDGVFPGVVREAGLRVRAVNLRELC